MNKDGEQFPQDYTKAVLDQHMSAADKAIYSMPKLPPLPTKKK